MKYFSIEELCKSNVAVKNNIDNTPTPSVIKNLTILIEECLDKVRDLWGNPLYVNSGYRCPSLNKKVGGARNSHHLLGFAADITTKSKENNKQLFELIKNSGLEYTQLIDENNGEWIHISHIPSNLKRENLYLSK